MNQTLNFLSWIILAVVSLALTGCGIGNISSNEATPETVSNVEVSDPFRDAVNKAMEASELTQTAQTSEDWSSVANLWQQAIDLMLSVPQSNPNYQVAQQKAEEYQANKAYAQSNVGGESDSEQTYEEMIDAIFTNNLEKVESLLAQGFDPNYPSQVRTEFNQPYYVISHAATWGTDAVVKELLEAGAKWDLVPNEALNDSLISASCSGQPFIVQELLNAGANPNHANLFGETPLIMSTSEICRTLDRDGKPLPPGSANHDQVLQILRNAGAQ